MAGSMSMPDLVETLKASLMDAVDVLASSGDTSLEDILRAAADDFRRVKPNIQFAEVTLVAGQRSYDLPANMGEFKYDTWGQGRKQPWESGYAGRLPRVSVAMVGATRNVVLDPAPTQAHIDDAGATLPYWYTIPHAIHESDPAQTTIPLVHRGLLILRAQMEAMRLLAIRNLTKPMQMIDGHSNAPRNGTASFLFDVLSKEFEMKAAQ